MLFKQDPGILSLLDINLQLIFSAALRHFDLQRTQHLDLRIVLQFGGGRIRKMLLKDHPVHVKLRVVAALFIACDVRVAGYVDALQIPSEDKVQRDYDGANQENQSRSDPSDQSAYRCILHVPALLYTRLPQ